MKLIKYLTIFIAALFTFHTVQAQLPDGSIAPDWTLTDLNGVQHNLYSYLNAGKSVIIDFSATWCPPCWNYHNNGPLEELYNTFGPPGTNEIMVFFLEGDMNTNDDCLYGNTSGCSAGGGTTQGNWVAGTTYPIINIPQSQQSVVTNYQIAYWPTLYAICADTKKTYEVGQATFTTWESWVLGSCNLNASADIADANCYMEGGIDLTPIAGHGNLAYQWNTGQTTQDIANIGPGTYWVTITDAHNYTFTSEQFVVGGTTTPFSATLLNQSPISCFGYSDGGMTVGPLQGSPPYSYNWSNGSTSGTATDLSAGWYQVSVTDGYNCEVVESYFIGEPTEVQLQYEIVNTTCDLENGELYFSGTGGTGSNYMFDIGDGFSTQDQYSGLPYGVYYVDIIDGNNCFNTEFLYIEYGPNPVANAGTNILLECGMPVVTLDGSGSTQGSHMIYTWETYNGNILSGENTLYPIVNQPGTYILYVENGIDGCVVSDEVVVTFQGVAPVVTGAAPGALTCAISTITLDATGSDSGSDFDIIWNTFNGNIVSGSNTLTPVVDQAGVYTLTIANINNGCSSSLDFVVSGDNDLPIFNAPSQTLTCINSQVEICVIAVSNVQNVVWDDGEEGLCRSVSFSGEFGFTAYGANGCSATGIIEVLADASLPVAVAGDGQTLTCTVQTIDLDATGSSQGDEFSFLWTTQDGNIVSDPSALIITVDAPGTYLLTVINTSNGCANSSQVTVNEYINTPDGTFTSQLDYNLIHVASILGGDNGVSVWSSSDGQNAAGPDATFIFNVSGDYEICHTYTNECGSATACETVTVTILPLTVNQTTVHPLCFGDHTGSITLSPNGGIPSYSVIWQGPDGFESNDLNISELAAGDYTYQVIDEAGTAASDVISIVQPEPIEVTVIITHETDGLANGGLEIAVLGGTPPYTYNWSNGSDTQNIFDLAAGDYHVIVTDANGCTFETVFTVDSRTNANNVRYLQSFDLMPNPVINELVVKIELEKSMNVELIVLNQLGQKLTRTTVSGLHSTTKLDVSDFAQGIYFIKLETEFGSVTRKIVKL